MELKTRRIVQVAVTQSPSDEWTAQQLREATPWGKGPKYLLHDRDSKYGIRFSSVAAGSGIAELRTPYRAPQANGVCVRFMGSLRRECLDHTLILHGKHLQRMVKEYTIYFNQDLPLSWLLHSSIEFLRYHFWVYEITYSGEIVH